MHGLEERQFIAWWAAVEPRIRVIGRKFLRSEDAAQDLAQDVAIAAVQSWGVFRDEAHFQAWVVTRARWLALDRIRLERRHGGPVPGSNELAQGEQKEGPGETDASIETLTEIMQAVSELPERQRVTLLRSMEGYNADQIAKELDILPATVRSLLRYARFRLSKSLGLSRPLTRDKQ